MPLFSRPRYTSLEIDHYIYRLLSIRRSFQPETAPRLVIVSYLPNEMAYHTLRVCVQTIRRFTPEPHEIWVVDNHSPWRYALKLLTLPGVNLVLNRTEPLPSEARRKMTKDDSVQMGWGNLNNLVASYANAAALEIGARLIDPGTHYLMTMHMDVMPCKTGWLSYLRSKMDDRVRVVGVRLDTARVPEGILHVLGYMVDFQLFKRLSLDFFPDLPRYDVGDRAITSLRQAGYDIFACQNTLLNENLIKSLPPVSPFRALHVDRSFDDAGNVIFLHLGRGVLKSSGAVGKGTTTEEWIKFADETLLA